MFGKAAPQWCARCCEGFIRHAERHMQFRSTGTMDFRADSIPSPFLCTVMYLSRTRNGGMHNSRTWEGPLIHAAQALLRRTPTSFSRA